MKLHTNGLTGMTLAAVLSMAATPLMAQTPAQPSTMSAPAKTDKAAGADTAFVMEAAKGGMMEVAKGKAATQHASRDDVKQFAQRMVDDHTKAGDELKSIASAAYDQVENHTPAPSQGSATQLISRRGS